MRFHHAIAVLSLLGLVLVGCAEQSPEEEPATTVPTAAPAGVDLSGVAIEVYQEPG